MLDWFYIVTMEDGSEWAVPVSAIATHRARHYKCEFGDDLDRSLREDTLPLFESDHSEVADWAQGNMDWADVESVVVRVKPPSPSCLKHGWLEPRDWAVKNPVD